MPPRGRSRPAPPSPDPRRGTRTPNPPSSRSPQDSPRSCRRRPSRGTCPRAPSVGGLDVNAATAAPPIPGVGIVVTPSRRPCSGPSRPRRTKWSGSMPRTASRRASARPPSSSPAPRGRSRRVSSPSPRPHLRLVDPIRRLTGSREPPESGPRHPAARTARDSSSPRRPSGIIPRPTRSPAMGGGAAVATRPIADHGRAGRSGASPGPGRPPASPPAPSTPSSMSHGWS